MALCRMTGAIWRSRRPSARGQGRSDLAAMASDPRAAIRNIPLGLLIEPGQDLQVIAPDLSRFALIAVAFPKFTDGRGYSQARQLRGTYGFTGELRATGEVLFDQLQFLARCGFDSSRLRMPRQSGCLQPAGGLVSGFSISLGSA